MVDQTLLPMRPVSIRLERWLGTALLLHFAYVLGVVNLLRQAPGEVLWLCHVSLFLAGLGLIAQSTRLVAIAFTAVAVPHALWLADSFCGLVLGWFPLGATAYILTTDTWTRIATCHHAYLAPLLLVIAWRRSLFSRAALPGAAALFLLLTVTSRIAVSPELNVNYAFYAVAAADHPFVIWVNGLDLVPHLLVLNAFVTILMFAPASLLLTCLAHRRRSPDHRPASMLALPGPS